MATDLKDVLAQYVPAKDLDEAVEALRDTEIAPEWFRAEAAKLGADAKEAQGLRARLESIESAPKRAEAYARVGLKGDLPKFASDWLDQNIPVDKLDDLVFIASKVKEGGFEVDLAEAQGTEQQPPAAQITDAIGKLSGGRPTTETYEEAVNKATSPEELDEVYRRFDKPVPAS